MTIVNYKYIFIGFSLLLVILSGASMWKLGIKKGIDFTGGTVVEVVYQKDVPTLDPVVLSTNNIKMYQTGTSSIRFISTDGYEKVSPIIANIVSAGGKYPFTVTQISNVGPTLGAEMTQKALIAIIVVVLAILAFIAFTFREVSYPVSSWKYGVIAMVTLLHDIIVPTGVYTFLSYKYGAEVDTLFIIALLTILGISISDKIVVFDRIRENLKLHKNMEFAQVVGKSLMQTFTRSVNTSVTVVLALIALYVFGPETTKYFALTLTVGMIVGTYSSIFVASPLLVVWNSSKKK
jgi:preprotein translocase subunit SecF